MASASPERMSPFGISTEPGIETISYSFCSRTSTSRKSSPASILAFRSRAEMVWPVAAAAASSDSVPQKAS